MNSTFRGAVEVFNLCRNLRERDALFAECVRTFEEFSLDGRTWMYRLESATNGKFHGEPLQEYVPASKKPNVRSSSTKPNLVDIYGFRPLEFPWQWLCPYEFSRYWRAEPLLTPSYYENMGVPSRTAWTDAGLALLRSKEFKDGQTQAKPGIHYLAVKSMDDAYFLFPSEPAQFYSNFRHAWVLVRKKRPDVVIIESLRLPSAKRSTMDNAKYCSLFFRPWTLLHGSTDIPHISLLCLTRHNLEEVYGNDNAQARPQNSCNHRQTVGNNIHWHDSWNEYIRGNIVSKTAAQLIQSFLLKTLAATDAVDEDNSDKQESDKDDDIAPLTINSASFRKLLLPSAEIEGNEDNVEGETLGRKLRKTSKARNMQVQFAKSMRLSHDVWASPEKHVAYSERFSIGHMFEESCEEHLHARKTSNKAVSSQAPFNEERHASATWLSLNIHTNLDVILDEIQNRKEKPSQEQLNVLKHFVQRLKLELLEARSNRVNADAQDPLFDLVHGLPGTGKSRVISWLREIMERGLGWTHGVQFVCLAFQNTMAAQINGFTIHHWSGIPAHNLEGQGTGDAHKQSIRCQALRVILIDEISMISAELLGSLEYVPICC
jgi:hypothetical protein